MALNWNYDATAYKANNSELLAEGKYRVRIINASETEARNGTSGLEISLEVNGHSNKLRHFIWYNYDYQARTNQLLGEFFDSFGISSEEQGNIESWKGKTGAVHVVHDEYKGRTIAKVSFCLKREYQNGIPEWSDKFSDYDSELRARENATFQPQNVKAIAPREFAGLSF